MGEKSEKRGWFGRKKNTESKPSRTMFGGYGSRQEQLDAMEAEAMGKPRKGK